MQENRVLRDISPYERDEERIWRWQLTDAYENNPGQFDVLAGHREAEGGCGLAGDFPTRNAAHSWIY